MPIKSSSLIHETALISADAKLDPSVQVGAYSIIKDNAVIGKNVIIGCHCIIGAEPFDDLTQKQWGVNIKDGAWIGDHVHIQNGVARNTHIDENTSINHGCYIGHDVKIGQDCMIGLSVTISGHSNLGNAVKIGPGSTLNNRSTIGDNAKIGIGSLVLHPVEKDSVVIGRPASDIAEQKKISAMMRELIGHKRKSMPVSTAAPGLAKYKAFLMPVFKLLPKKLQYHIKNMISR